MRTLVPSETLVYLETNDLGAALQPIVDSKPFTEAAKSKPDLSALKGVQLAVAVTGFETSEEKITDEHSIGRIQPHFVTVAETHAWQFQTVRFAEQKLGAFVAEMYDGEPKLERSEKRDGRFFTWTAADGRKAFALVKGSLVYFGNDETAIDKCLAVKLDGADSIVTTGKVQPADPATLASGYVSTDGIAQIANIIGLKFASEAGEDSEVQSAIAGILPQLLRNSITDITWTAKATTYKDWGQEAGYRDIYLIKTNPEAAQVLSESAAPGGLDSPGIEFLPLDTPVASYYNLRDPQTAWHTILFLAQKQVDPAQGRIIGLFSGLLFEPYGIRDPEMFLAGAGTNLLTANMDPDGDKPLVIAEVRDVEKVKKALVPELQMDKQATTDIGVEIWRSADGELAAAFSGKYAIVGESESVLKCLRQKLGSVDVKSSVYMALNGAPVRAVTTIGFDPNSAGRIAEILSEKRSEKVQVESLYHTETRFTKAGIERKITSDFGLIGSVIAQLNDN